MMMRSLHLVINGTHNTDMEVAFNSQMESLTEPNVFGQQQSYGPKHLNDRYSKLHVIIQLQGRLELPCGPCRLGLCLNIYRCFGMLSLLKVFPYNLLIICALYRLEIGMFKYV